MYWRSTIKLTRAFIQVLIQILVNLCNGTHWSLRTSSLFRLHQICKELQIIEREESFFTQRKYKQEENVKEYCFPVCQCSTLKLENQTGKHGQLKKKDAHAAFILPEN